MFPGFVLLRERQRNARNLKRGKPCGGEEEISPGVIPRHQESFPLSEKRTAMKGEASFWAWRPLAVCLR
jgi:hypothetical protein